MSANLETKEVKVAEPETIEMKETVFSLDDDAGQEEVTLTSTDNKKFKVTKKVALMSRLLMETIEGDSHVTEIPVPGVREDVLRYVVEYMNHHQGIPESIIEKPLKSKIMKDVCKDPWDAQFIDGLAEHRQTLYDLILGANYMDIKCLLHLGCAKVASLIKGQPLEKIKEILAIHQAASTSASSTDAVATSPPSTVPNTSATSSTGESVTIHS